MDSPHSNKREELQDIKRRLFDVVDWQAALNETKGDEELLADVLDAIIEEFPDLLKILRQSIDSKDGSTLVRTAHTMKGAFRSLNDEAVKLCGEMENFGYRGDFNKADAAYPGLFRASQAIILALQSYRPRLNARRKQTWLVDVVGGVARFGDWLWRVRKIAKIAIYLLAIVWVLLYVADRLNVAEGRSRTLIQHVHPKSAQPLEVNERITRQRRQLKLNVVDATLEDSGIATIKPSVFDVARNDIASKRVQRC